MTRGPRRCGTAIERASRALCSKPRSRSYMAFGIVFALGASATYAYLTLISVVVFAVLGWIVRARSIASPAVDDQSTDRTVQPPSLRAENGRGAEPTPAPRASRVRPVRRHRRPEGDQRRLRSQGRGPRDRGRRSILLRSVRAVDSVARVGGDEFAVLLPETSAHQASVLARRIARHVADHREESIRGLAVSIGITELEATGQTESLDVLAVADAALYRAKAAEAGTSPWPGRWSQRRRRHGTPRSWMERGSSTGERRAGAR